MKPKGLFTVSDRDSDLLWVQCTSMELFTAIALAIATSLSLNLEWVLHPF